MVVLLNAIIQDCYYYVYLQASPLPDITWLKDNVPVAKHVTITNSEKVSQLLIPTSDRSDSGIYTIIVKNMVGQETFNVEIRVTGNLNNHNFYVATSLILFKMLSSLETHFKPLSLYSVG